MILDKINVPSDLKNLNKLELENLSKEIREAILNRVSNVGGHVGPNLGTVELTIALHYVFNSPVDKIVFDVSHQCYTHKILTGRKKGFLDSNYFEEISGYTNPKESAHDFFKVGHTATSISLACGLAKARDLKKIKENIIAIIGDGSLSGGEAYEGLNNVAELKSNFIVIVNDNDMSISENHGGIYKNLKLLRQTNGKAECNIFKSLGFDYCYVKDGNAIESLIEVFEKVKDVDHPMVVHINTIKGKGLDYAIKDKETWHWSTPFDVELGKRKNNVVVKKYADITADYLLNVAKKDNRLMIVTPAIPHIFKFTPAFRQELGEQYIDVGIAEEHAIAYASGLAKNGANPVLCMHSSFIQRTYDQLSQDLALNNNPAVILVFRSGISSTDDTHLGVFDIPLISNIPNIVYLAPTCSEEYISMLDWGIKQKEYPIAIRVPDGPILERNIECPTDYSNINEYKIEESGEQVAIIALGNFYALGKKVKDLLKQKHNIEASLINPRFITGLDKYLLEKLKENHQIVITLEDGILDGGFGEKISAYYSTSDMKVLNFGAKKEFTDRVPLKDLFERYHLTPDLIVSDIIDTINK